MWAQTRHALEFFHRHLPFWEMMAMPDNVKGDGVWCFGKPRQCYVVYLPPATHAEIQLPKGRYTLSWFNPRSGGDLIAGTNLRGQGWHSLGTPPSDPNKDWVAFLKRR